MKNAVLTITPNPSLDISGFVDRIIPNEKTYVQDEAHAPGGNAINVARILCRLKVPVVASGFLGGAAGYEVASLLKKENIRQHFIAIKEPTRTNVTISSRHHHQQTRLSFSGPRIEPREKDQLSRFVRSQHHMGILVIGGSLPPNFSVRDLTGFISIAQKKNASVVIDCPGAILRHLTKHKLLLIKPNLEEFQLMTQSRVRTLSAVKKKALQLLQSVSYVCVSSVEGGALLVTSSGCFFGRIPRVKIRSTVGAGDSMVGAMVAQLFKGNSSASDILRWGLAAAAATLSEEGTTLGSASQIEELYKKTVVIEVS
ncbi:MAG: hexose kinase [Bdellovibrionales bacterium]|nr:hexose kinase [Bdellovibrionales bacterium]